MAQAHGVDRPITGIMRALSGVLTQRQLTLKDVCICNVRKLHRPRMSDAL